MKKLLLLFIALTVSLFVNAQTLDLSQTLATDTTVKKGVLSNGMTYYIKSTDVVKDAASYYIIQNVGSILENEDQRGLAHFLEHMAFNGTKNFPGKGILNTLEKQGAVFGKDINAYTSFDETVYNLNNIPTKDGLVDISLTILKDWSNYLLLTNEEIDAERGVIKEEWRTRQSGQGRLFEVSLPVLFNKSKYAERLPIGLMSVVEGFDYKALRDFYHDWYRTDLQAIAIIGDVNVDEIEQKIKESFSKIPAVKKPRERFTVHVPDNEKMLFGLGTDLEVSTARISFGIRHKRIFKPETVADLKQKLLESMATSLLSARIAEKAQNPETPYLAAVTGYGPSMVRTSNNFSLEIYPKENQQKGAFKAALTEVVRAVKFGFIQPEMARSVAQINSRYKNQIAKKNDINHALIEQSIQSNFLYNSTITDIEKEYEVAKQLLNTITIEELHNTIKRLYTQNNRYLYVVGVEGHDNLTEESANQIIDQVENDINITAYIEALAGKKLVSDLDIKAGTIEETVQNSEIGSTTFTLSNGVKVHYKFTDKEKDNVALNAVSYGGTSLLNDEDLPSAGLISDLIFLSGLGDFNATDLKKILAGKTANVRVSLGEIDENIFGSSNTTDVETMLQLTYLQFVKPRFDEEAYKVLLGYLKNYVTSRSNDINEKIKDSLTVAVYGKNNPKKRIFNQEYANDISFEKIKSIYENRFANASDFEFFIVGDVKEDQLKPILEQYLASLPTKNTKETFKDNGAKWLSKTIDKDIYLKMEDPKASVNIVYKKEMPYTLKSAVYTKALGDILQLRVTEMVRESEGGAYSPNANATLVREPKSLAQVSFKFDCNPDLADKLVEIVNNEFQKIAKGNILEDDLNKIKTNFIKEREQSKDKNNYDMQLLKNYYRFDYNMNDTKNFEDIVNKMCDKDIKKMAEQIVKKGNNYEIVFKPAQ
ncbi:zinc protease [Tenacibaculum adriaticum]|uniref:Zinc protease n=1 Tax=Tenacibaculum adriaticum TaxID=413713 RepID=A0A5S5E0C6_9FLAO|nr:M16 family metallopeptidase [Tenacibaculum adriaticum]TYQ00200.1 zinc protease [Tenacibaculum adriaticum]